MPASENKSISILHQSVNFIKTFNAIYWWDSREGAKQSKGHRCIVESGDRLYLEECIEKQFALTQTDRAIYNQLGSESEPASAASVTYKSPGKKRAFGLLSICHTFHSGSVYVSISLSQGVGGWEDIYDPIQRHDISNTGRKEPRSAIQYQQVH